jgi:hypothetical protein
MFQSRGGSVYSRSRYGSTASASTETISSGQTVLDVFELVASANVRFSSRFRIIRRLGQQRDVVLFHDAKPDAVTPHLTLLEGDPAGPRRVWGHLHAERSMEPLWSPVVANGGKGDGRSWPRNARNQAKTLASGCHRLPETFHGKEGSMPAFR